MISQWYFSTQNQEFLSSYGEDNVAVQTSEHALNAYLTWKVLFAKLPIPQVILLLRVEFVNSMALFVGSWSPMIFHRILCM